MQSLHVSDILLTYCLWRKEWNVLLSQSCAITAMTRTFGCVMTSVFIMDWKNEFHHWGLWWCCCYAISIQHGVRDMMTHLALMVSSLNFGQLKCEHQKIACCRCTLSWAEIFQLFVTQFSTFDVTMLEDAWITQMVNVFFNLCSSWMNKYPEIFRKNSRALITWWFY